MAQNQNKLSPDTQITITLGGIISIIGSIFIIIFGFYSLVIQPDIESLKSSAEKNYQELKIQNEKINDHIIQINNSIGTMSGSIDGINQRFGDLRSAVTDRPNVSGSLR